MKNLILSLLLLINVAAFCQSSFDRWVPTSGTNTYTTNITSFPGSYNNTQAYVKFGNTNSGASTININSLGASNLRMWDGDSWEPLTSGQIDVNTVYKIAYNGSYFTMESFGAGGGLIDETLTDDITIDVDTHSLTITNNNSGVQVSNDGTGNIGMLSGDPGGAFLAGPDGAQILPDKSGPQPAEGSLFIVGSDGYVDELSIGTSGQVLTSDGTTASWESRYILDSATPSTAGSTITLDMNSQIQRLFVGSASFSTPKTLAISNATNALVFNFHFQITDIAATLTLPSGWLMSDALFASNVWTPVTTGLYELGGSFDGTNWKIKIMGPFN